MNKREVIIGGISFAVGAAGAGTSVYFLTKKRAQNRANAYAVEEIQSVKDTYKLLRKEPPYDDPATAVKAYLERMDELQYMATAGIEAAETAAENAAVEAANRLAESLEEQDEIKQDVEDASEILDNYRPVSEAGKQAVRNIFELVDDNLSRESMAASPAERDSRDAFDLLAARDPLDPFVISTDDFHDDSNEFDKVTITYFEADDTLSDDSEKLIPNKEELVGSENLNKFGQDSDDKDTVYIRNERARTDYEVIRDEGSYAEIVLGYKEMEDHKRVKRMREHE